MSEISKQKESPEQLRERWNEQVNTATWLSQPGEKGEMLGLSDEIIAEVIDKDTHWIVTKFSGLPPNFSPSPSKLKTLVGEYSYIFTILKLLGGDPKNREDKVAEGIRAKIKYTSKNRQDDALHPGWEASE